MTAGTVGWVAVTVLLVVPAVVCGLKGRWGAAGFGGLVVMLIWYAVEFTDLANYGHWAAAFIGMLTSLLLVAIASDYARPRSLWARRFYDEANKRSAELRETETHRPGAGEIGAMRHYGQTRFGRRRDDDA